MAAAILGLVRVLEQVVGLPTWVFASTIVLLIVGLPIMVATSVVEQRRVEGGSAGVADWLTCKRSAIGGGAAFTLLALGTGVYMAMRAAGIGPAATLMATGAFEAFDRILLADFEDFTDDPDHAATVTELLRIGMWICCGTATRSFCR